MTQKNLSLFIVILLLGFIISNFLINNYNKTILNNSSKSKTNKKNLIIIYNSKIPTTEKRINELFNNYEIKQTITNYYNTSKTDVNSPKNQLPYEMIGYFQQMITPFNPFIIIITDNQFNIDNMLPSTITPFYLKTALDYSYNQNKYKNFIEYLKQNN